MSIDIGRRVAKHDYGDQFAPYTCVVVKLTDSDTTFTAGNESGRTLTVENLWASQTMADNLLEQVRGARHQPFTAIGAILDPAAEIGDSVTIDGVAGVMYRRNQRFGTLYRTDISSPGDEEINHEIPYYPPVKRYLNRVNGIARGAAAAAATALKREDGIEEDYKELVARVEGVAAGMQSYVLNKTFDDYKISVARLFAEVEDTENEIASDLAIQASLIDGLKTATAILTSRVGDTEASLALKAETKTVKDLDGRVSTVESAQTSLSARVGSAEAALTLKADASTVTGLATSVATLSADYVDINSRLTNITSSLVVNNGASSFKGNVFVDGAFMTYTNYIGVGGAFYEPVSITSTTGNRTVLGVA